MDKLQTRESMEPRYWWRMLQPRVSFPARPALPSGMKLLLAWNSFWLNGTTLGNQVLKLILYEHFVIVRITSFNGAIKLYVFMNVCVYVITKWKKLITNLSLHNSGIHFSMPIFATETFSSFSYGTTARSLYFNYFL